MSQLSQQLAEVRRQLERHRTLCRREVELREAVDQHAYRLETFEMQLDMLAGDIRRLEGFGLGSLVSGMLGNKHERIHALKTAHAEKQEELEACRAALARLQHELAAVEPELQSLQGCEKRYEALFARQEEAVLASSGDRAESLKAAARELAGVEERLRATRKAVEAADSLMTYVGTAKISVRQVGQRKLTGEGLVGGAYNAVMSQALNPSRSGVEAALERLLAALDVVREALPADSSGEETELAAGILAYCERFCGRVALEEDCGALVECETETADMQRRLMDLQRDLERIRAEADTRRRVLIEND